MSALGRYILCSALFLCATLCLIFARFTGAREGYDVFLGVAALLTYTGAFRALGYAMHAEDQNLRKD